MTYDDLINTTVRQSPKAVAEVLRNLADNLENGEEFTVSAGGESGTVGAPRDVLDVELELEREDEYGEIDEIELEIELEWRVDMSEQATGADGNDEIEIN
jgi:amphi-Trp domain-containing protein